MIEFKIFKAAGIILFLSSFFLAWEGFASTVPFSQLDVLLNKVCPASIPKTSDEIGSNTTSEPSDCPRLVEQAHSMRSAHLTMGSLFLKISFVSLSMGIIMLVSSVRANNRYHIKIAELSESVS